MHGVGGTIGALLNGVFASAALIDGHPAAGVLAEQGRFGLILGQLQAVVVAYGIAAIGTLAIALAISSAACPSAFQKPRISGWTSANTAKTPTRSGPVPWSWIDPPNPSSRCLSLKKATVDASSSLKRSISSKVLVKLRLAGGCRHAVMAMKGWQQW